MWARPRSTSTTSQETSRSTTATNFTFFLSLFSLPFPPLFFFKCQTQELPSQSGRKHRNTRQCNINSRWSSKLRINNKHPSQKSSLSDVCPRLARVKNHPCGSRPCDKVESRCRIGVTRWRHTHPQRFVFKPSVQAGTHHFRVI